MCSLHLTTQDLTSSLAKDTTEETAWVNNLVINYRRKRGVLTLRVATMSYHFYSTAVKFWGNNSNIIVTMVIVACIPQNVLVQHVSIGMYTYIPSNKDTLAFPQDIQ